MFQGLLVHGRHVGASSDHSESARRPKAARRSPRASRPIRKRWPRCAARRHQPFAVRAPSPRAPAPALGGLPTAGSTRPQAEDPGGGASSTPDQAPPLKGRCRARRGMARPCGARCREASRTGGWPSRCPRGPAGRRAFGLWRASGRRPISIGSGMSDRASSTGRQRDPQGSMRFSSASTIAPQAFVVVVIPVPSLSHSVGVPGRG